MYAGAIVIETDRPMNDMETLARKTLAAINPNLAVVKFQTFDAQIADRFTEERMLARLTMLFGGSGAAAGGDWALWRDLLHCGAADLGDRHSHGAWSRTQERDCDGYAWSDHPDLAWTGDRSSHCAAVCAICEGATL